MTKFPQIEGLRATLAITVIIAHCAQIIDVPSNPTVVHKLFLLGQISVMIFIIVSGFVIANLIIEKQEPYGPYIVRRFFRIYPLYIICCIAGAATLWMYPEALRQLPWANAAPWDSVIASQSDRFGEHSIAHALLLHGAISNNVLPYSAFVFLPPSWSLSLEWQFYLTAPLIVAWCTQRRTLLLIVCTIAAALFYRGTFGTFELESALPGAGPYFMIGIASRLLWPHLRGTIKNPATLALGFTALIPMSNQNIVSVLLWAIFFCFLCADQHSPAVFDKVFSSPIAMFWGKRSYSIYLTHFPILTVCAWALTHFALPRWEFALALAFITLPITAIATMATYWLIERPGIALGRRLSYNLPNRRSRVISDAPMSGSARPPT